ncbi:hypothetical protein P22_2967 [Propionispora sp. 2/2-37]|uniref:glycerate kinase type-2 family protein n=1 Tax=Propionispora sp. 2/2-37 TaxID=1677858 RepID=UPI0006BB8B14|nr:glycerate kinase [Propionispora sp. 2/2-37]CUH96856.1 hypothetical protein P22_2967 [Propionispora sp. 2/2-37]
MGNIHQDAETMIRQGITAVLPQAAVKEALQGRQFPGRVYLVAIGKAAYAMAKAAQEVLAEPITAGVVITKYGHAQGALTGMDIIEAGHPVPDENTLLGTEKVLDMVSSLKREDTVLFLVSGGGSALFEKPVDGVTLADLSRITGQLLASGAGIVEINTIRKRLSGVKGGRFAQACRPAGMVSIVLSDVLGDRPDMIASGPACADQSTAEEALAIIKKYKLVLPEPVLAKLRVETPKRIDHVETIVTGSVRFLCSHMAGIARGLGYQPWILTTQMDCEAKEGGRFLAAIAKAISDGTSSFVRPCAIIAGGETVVTVTGQGKGGRNQEFALAAAEEIAGLPDTLIFSLGSDGTDGPTDAAGGLVDGQTKVRLLEKKIKIGEYLSDNNAYHALLASEGLIFTGPTGTNVNDVAVLLCK